MVILRVFDPPMCCSTGVCGPKVNPVLPRFAADLNWLKSKGVQVERFNLAQDPEAFAKDSVVEQMLTKAGMGCLPLILVDGRVVSQGVYPSKDELMAFTGITDQKSANKDSVSSFLRVTAQSRRSSIQNRGGECCGESGCCK
jgi:hypothetical protein